MFLSHLYETSRLNGFDLHSYEGKRVYYNKDRNYISVIAKIACGISLMITAISMHNSKNEATLGFIFLACFGELLLLNSIFETIGRLLLKNPVFILKGEFLFYLRTNRSYDIREYTFADEYTGKHNHYATFCMFDKKGQRIIAEKNWHLKVTASST